MKTLSRKIESEAVSLYRNYVAILERGEEPATLLSIIEFNRGSILSSINDKRINPSNTIDRIYRQAHAHILRHLRLDPVLAQRLMDFRAARKARDEQKAAEEQRSWLPLPALKSA